MRLRRKPRHLFWVATANLQSVPQRPAGDVVVSVHTVLDHPAALIGWQEVQPEYYKDALESFDGRWLHFCIDTNTPITVNNSIFRAIRSGSLVILPAKKGVHTERNLTWVIAQHRGSGRKFLFFNFHQISHPEESPERMEEWSRAKFLIRSKLADWVSSGYNVIGVGDYNKVDSPVLGREVAGFPVVYHIMTRALDYILSIRFRNMVVKSIDNVKTGSDHTAKFVQFKIW